MLSLCISKYAETREKDIEKRQLAGEQTSARPVGRLIHLAKSRARRPANKAHRKITRGGAELRKERRCRKRCAARRHSHYWTSQRVFHIPSDSINCASLRCKRVEGFEREGGCGTARSPEYALGAAKGSEMKRMIVYCTRNPCVAILRAPSLTIHPEPTGVSGHDISPLTNCRASNSFEYSSPGSSCQSKALLHLWQLVCLAIFSDLMPFLFRRQFTQLTLFVNQFSFSPKVSVSGLCSYFYSHFRHRRGSYHYYSFEPSHISLLKTVPRCRYEKK